MKIIACNCKQCRLVKTNRNSKAKKRIKRYLNRLRRRDLEDTKIKNYYWA